MLSNFFSQLRAEANIGSWTSDVDPKYSEKLQREREAREYRVLRLGTLAAIAIYISFGLLDLIVLPELAPWLIFTRVGIGLCFLACMEIGRRVGLSLGQLQALAAGGIAVGGCGWLLVAVSAENQSVLGFFMIYGTTFLLGANLFFNFRFWLCCASSVPVTAVFVATILGPLETIPEVKLLLSLFFVCCLALTLYLSWCLSMERYHSFINSAEAKIQKRIVEKKSEQLSIIANTDPLTGLRNRRFISDAFESFSHDALAADKHLGIVLIDVDYFKRYNDAYGHKLGDDCLVAISGVFDRISYEFDGVIGRHGGEEFIGIFKVDNGDDLLTIAKSICSHVEKLEIAHDNRNDNRSVITVSVGATIADPVSATLDQMTQEADHALYYSKFIGRACASLFDPELHDQVGEGEKLNKAIKQAIKKDLVSVVYQPIYASDDKKLFGYETLMRIVDEEGNSVSPALFIPVAEKTGDINHLGLWVIARVCEDIAQNRLPGTISINISAVQLRNPNFPIQVASILGRHGVYPGKIALEVTEGQDIFDCDQTRESLRNLRHLGVEIWLDDFGTGYAGLSWLDEFKFDTIKIDRAFLNNSHDSEGRRFLTDIVEMLKNRKVRVLCEGVETQEHVDLLDSLKVELLQGYYLGRPAPIDAFIPEENSESVRNA